jgi:hypothetical protein
MNLQDLFWVALVIVLLVALGIGAGIRNNLAALAVELHSELEALHQLLDSRLQLGVDKHDIEPIVYLASALLYEKREVHKCPECGALPTFQMNRETLGTEGGSATLLRLILAGGLTGGVWHYTYHVEDCSLRKPGSAVVGHPTEEEE